MSSTISSISPSSSAPIFTNYLSQAQTGNGQDSFTSPIISVSSQTCSIPTNPPINMSHIASKLNDHVVISLLAATTHVIHISDLENIFQSSLSSDEDAPPPLIRPDRISMIGQSSNLTETTQPAKIVGKTPQKAIQNAQKLHTSIPDEHLKRFICIICDKSFTRCENFQLHTYKHLPKDQWPLKCSSCAKPFFRPNNLKSHEKRRHKTHVRPIRTSMTEQSANLTAISQSATNVNRVQQKAIQNAKKLHATTQKKPQKKHKCHKCNKGFTRYDCLTTHEFTHISKDLWPFQCSQCSTMFYKRYNLRVHENTIHGMHKEMREFTCTICTKTYTTNQNLKKHINKKH